MIRHSLILSGRFQSVVGRNFVSKTCVAQAKIVELVPALGESITEGSIAKWSKNVGDRVAIDDVVVIVETDKVTVDIKSTNAGVLTAQLATDTVSTIVVLRILSSITLMIKYYSFALFSFLTCRW